MTKKVSEINGSVKVRRIPNRYNTIKEYQVTLYRGTEEKLIEKLGGDLNNLLAFCDNGFKFDDLTARHYGGSVKIGWVKEKDVFGKVYTSFYTGNQENPEDKLTYMVEVFID